MKSLFTTLIIFCLLTPLFSQTEQGTLFIGGQSSVSFQSQTQELDGGGQEVTTNSFQFAPVGGYFVTDNLVIGAEFNLAFANTEFGQQEASSSSFTLGPIARYYFGEDNIRFFPQLGFGFLFGSTESGGEEQDFNGLTFNVGGGVAFFVSEKVALEGLINFDFGSQELEQVGGQEVEVDVRDFTIGFGVSVFLN